MRATLTVLLTLVFSLLSAGLCAAGERVALVVGNSDYRNITPLRTPANDVALITGKLADAAFTTISSTDLEAGNFDELVRGAVDIWANYQAGVEDQVGEAPVIEAVLFYYAGHAVQFGGENYLLPTDIRPERADIEARGLRMNDIIDALRRVRAETYIIILDSCRNNPFEDMADRSNGLAEIDADVGHYIAFSAKPGGVALDGSGPNSPFAEALAEFLPYQNIPIESMFRNVRRVVYQSSNNQQLPWDSSSLITEFRFMPTNPFGELELRRSERQEAERQLWQKVTAKKGDRKGIEVYLRLYPNGLFVHEARQLLGTDQ